MKKYILLLLFLFNLTSNHLFATNWKRISKEIKWKQSTLNGGWYVDYYYKLRQNSNCLSQFNVSPKDTIYILELHADYSDSSLTLMAWNSKKEIACISHDFLSNTFEYETQMPYPLYMRELVSEWNIPKIREEEKENGEMNPQCYVYATQIIFNKGKYLINCIRFKDFFNIARDSY